MEYTISFRNGNKLVINADDNPANALIANAASETPKSPIWVPDPGILLNPYDVTSIVPTYLAKSGSRL